MKLGFTWTLIGLVFLALLLGVTSDAQQSVNPNSGQASQPVTGLNGPGRVGSDLPAATQPAPNPNPPAANAPAQTTSAPATTTNSTNADDNPYDPILEPPPLPKGKTTLIGGTATNVDHVRNRLTVQPFGKGAKVKVFVDERSHIYRNGTETTILGVHKGDRVYVDTMLAQDNRIFARNLRVLTDAAMAEMRGQVIGTNPEHGTISVRDQLSAKPVTFSVSGATKYSSTKGTATASDVQAGSIIDVQFSPRRDQTVAQEIVVLAKPGDNYVFSGVVTSMDMRTNSFYVDNKSDEQSYEVHFSRSTVSDPDALKVGVEVTARATFDGKQYIANNVRVEKPDQGEPQSEVQ
jgi:hypothetical protein